MVRNVILVGLHIEATVPAHCNRTARQHNVTQRHAAQCKIQHDTTRHETTRRNAILVRLAYTAMFH